ncbi:hypothetical protein Lal_00041855 [Lupinus albus]|uniref:Putative Homeobox domain-containing protein n=1 Tax=Lupinus albus TaxID=3870 RepID=A0A6A4QXD7_LUPAL|nr:putative Homeobox domain-containing protein [Lupinus albus]KAF1895575.1 hypothetical protein Lal_00041855 [Lupinus albus]
MAKKTLPVGRTSRYKHLGFDSFHSRDLLIWIKDLALEPGNKKASHCRLSIQMLEVRKLMNIHDDKSLKKKRKIEHYMDDGKSTCTFELLNKEKYNKQVAKNHTRGESSNLSCLGKSEEKCSFEGVRGHVAFLVSNGIVEHCNSCWHDCSHSNGSSQEIKGKVFHATDNDKDCTLCCEDYSHLRDFDKSMPSPMKQGNLKGHFESFEDRSSNTIGISVKEKQNIELSGELKSLINKDFDDSSSRNSYSLRLGKEDWKIIHPLPFHDNHCPRLVIPVGPRFQAEIPHHENLTNIRQHHFNDDFKWFSNEVWPMPTIVETDSKGVGNGRHEACSCDFPGSIDCVQLHISEARERLKLEIGTTFSTWKFDEMGEDVSKSWTMEEQKKFESLTRTSLSSDMDFWKIAMENFPTKSMKSMINYYYNVCIPRRLSRETRASFVAIDSDDDNLMEEDDYSTTTMEIVPICKLRKSRKTNSPF